MSALGSLLLGALGVAALAAAWLAVQIVWGRSFDDGGDPDVLVRRRDCFGCQDIGHCGRTRPDPGDPS
ncbi:MAG: hypothetical protein ACQGVC_10315 [Myxococcota bacterium]